MKKMPYFCSHVNINFHDLGPQSDATVLISDFLCLSENHPADNHLINAIILKPDKNILKSEIFYLYGEFSEQIAEQLPAQKFYITVIQNIRSSVPVPPNSAILQICRTILQICRPDGADCNMPHDSTNMSPRRG